MTCPAAPFRHLLRLTDHVGLLEHAEGIVPQHQHGYCVDDVARGLVVVSREPSPAPELVTLARRYLYFLARAQAPDGRFRNRLGYDRRWNDEPGTEDCWGRALWGLGTAAARPHTLEIRDESLTRFGQSAQVRSPWPHAMAFAALGADEVLETWPDHPGALGLLAGATAVIGEPPTNATWPWPAARLSYANAAMAEAVIVAGWRLGNDRVLQSGLRMLEWLLAGEDRHRHPPGRPGGGGDSPRPPVGSTGRRLGSRRGAPCFRPAADRGCRTGGRMHARRDGHRRLELAYRRRHVRGVVPR